MVRGLLIRALPVVFAAAAFASPQAGAPAPAGTISFDVPGRSDSTPWVAALGQTVAVAWGASAENGADVFVKVSRDGGATFGQPRQVNRTAGEGRLGGELPPRVSIAPAANGGTPVLAVAWTARVNGRTQIRTAVSRDGGATFGEPTTLSAPGAAGDRGWPSMTLDASGTPHAIWLDHRGLAARQSGSGGGRAGHHRVGPHDGVAMAQQSGLYYANGGVAVPAERELTKSVCYCCKTALAAGANGTLYAAWRHVYAGNIRDIAFAASRDGGKTFSTPVRVSEDRWAIDGCPDDGPALAVDATGLVHIVWPTVISGRTPQGALFYSTTRDGRTFTPRVRIPTLGSLKPSHPQIAVDAAGRIAVAWDEFTGGRRVAAVRTIKPRRDGATFGEIVRLGNGNAAQYPVIAPTPKGMLAVWSTGGQTSEVLAQVVDLK